MLKKISPHSIKLVVRFFFVALYFIAPSVAHADEACWKDPNNTQALDVPTLKGLSCIFQDLLGISLRVLGLIVFIMIIVGGFRILTAGDDPKAAESGKSVITYGVIGLAVAVLAIFIVTAIANFAGLGPGNNINILEFVIGK